MTSPSFWRKFGPVSARARGLPHTCPRRGRSALAVIGRCRRIVAVVRVAAVVVVIVAAVCRRRRVVAVVRRTTGAATLLISRTSAWANGPARTRRRLTARNGEQREQRQHCQAAFHGSVSVEVGAVNGRHPSCAVNGPNCPYVRDAIRHPRAQGNDRLSRARLIHMIVRRITPAGESKQRALPDLRLLYMGGEKLPRDLARRWAAGRRWEDGYGPTECAVTTTRTRIHSNMSSRSACRFATLRCARSPTRNRFVIAVARSVLRNHAAASARPVGRRRINAHAPCGSRHS